ncbi:MAG: BamA/TamA family outer membrane protein [Proteobacteria bacterium]|nr:BamA/TamA family outer membrane protein [Pseudomonadota bacterium]
MQVDVRGLPEEIRDNVMVFLSVERYKKADDLSAQTLERLQNRIDREVKAALKPFGLYAPEVKSEVARSGNNSDRDWRVTVTVEPGPAVMVGQVDVKVTGPGATDPVFRRILDTPPIRRGDQLSHPAYESLKGSLQRAAANYGYLDATMVRNELLVDPPQLTASVALEIDTGARYRFGATSIEQDVIDEVLVRRYLRYTQDEPFDATELLRTQFALDDSQYFSTVEVLPEERDREQHIVPISIQAEAARRHRYSFGVGYGTDTEARGTVTWENRRINARGHRFRTEIRAAARTKSLSARYLIPIGDPAVEKLLFELNDRSEDFADLQTNSLDFRPSITHVRGRWQRELFTIATRTTSDSANLNLTDTLLIPGISYALVPRGYLGEALFGRELYAELRGSQSSLGSDSDFLQVRAPAERVFDIAPGWHVVGRIEVGATAVGEFSQLPGSQRFFAGGDRSVRGFGFNQLSPLTPIIDPLSGLQALDPVSGEPLFEKLGGKHLLAGSTELVRDLPRNFAVALFADFGNAFDKFGDPIEYAVGLGIRYRLPVVTVGIDIAQALTTPAGDGTRPGPRFHINFSPKL